VSTPKTTNFNKYQTRNPIVSLALNRFYNAVRKQLDAENFNDLLDAGCGEGLAIARLRDSLPPSVTGVDQNRESLDYARRLNPGANFQFEDLKHLSFPRKHFDAILCLEVLEHIPDPDLAIAELSRVCRSKAIFSVPFEPWFRLGSLVWAAV